MKPIDLAKTLAAEMPEEVFDTGLLTGDTLRVCKKGEKYVVISYRKPQVTGLWLDGTEDPLRIPMPGLALARIVNKGSITYQMMAFKRRPQPGSTGFVVPLPNVSNTVCTGTIPRIPDALLRDANMDPDWSILLGTRFGNHNLPRKCVSEPDDLRKLYFRLHREKAKIYPHAELIELKQTFGEWVGGMLK